MRTINIEYNPRENEKKQIPDTEHIWLEGQFSTPPQARISEASTAENKTQVNNLWILC